MKKINFLGDSITEGAVAGTPENMYTAVCCRLVKAKEQNYGVSGTRIARQKVHNGNPDEDFVLRARWMDFSADFTFIFGGTNDYGHGDAPMGEFGDTTPYTFYGAVDNLLKYVTERISTDKLCFILPTHRYNENDPNGDKKPLPVGTLEDYKNAIKKVCSKYNVETLEIKSLPSNVPEGSSKFYFDGLHPNPLGHKLLGKELAEYLKDKKGF